MADHLTEEEQIEALKNWWKEYWASVVLPIALVAVGYFGWNLWQGYEKQQAAKGYEAYQALLEALEVEPGAVLSDEQRATGKVLAAGLVKDFGGSLYGDYANLILARIAVEEGALDLAQESLKKVVEAGQNEAMHDLAKSRLARILIAQRQFAEALALVAASQSSEYAALFAEIRGDAHAAQGDADAAKAAYQEALDKLLEPQMSRRSIIQLKLDGAPLLAAQLVADGAALADDVEATEASEAAASAETADAGTGAP